MSIPKSLTAVMGLIDHALLRPTLTDAEVERGARMAARCGVASVCVKPCQVSRVRSSLEGCPVAVGAVVGFPHGGSCVETKVAEAERALDDGASEIDAVINVGKVLSENWDYLEREIRALNLAVTSKAGLLKIIFETAYLEDRHKVELCRIASTCGVAFVKTSTGFDFVEQPDGSSRTCGATDHDVELMVQSVSGGVKVKASGGVRTLDDVLRLSRLGAARIGTSATEGILEEARRRGY